VDRNFKKNLQKKRKVSSKNGLYRQQKKGPFVVCDKKNCFVIATV